MGISVVVTREPGGSPGAEALREVILSGKAAPFGPGGRGDSVQRRADRPYRQYDRARAGARRLGHFAIVSPIRRAPIRARRASSIRR